MLSAALAIANAVQFSVCSGVLRVLGLARALPRDIVLKTNAQRPNMVFGAAPVANSGGGSGMRCGLHARGLRPLAFAQKHVLSA